MKAKKQKAGIALAILLCGPMMLGTAPAQTVPPPPSVSALNEKPLTLREAAQMAVLNNPEVLQRWHTVRAAQGERDAARGGLFPRVDLNASTGSERRSDIATSSYSRSNGSLTLTQLLFDGFATFGEVRRLDHNTRVRLFELLFTSETVALEAARAYYDVLRYRELVRLAEENYVEHRSVFAQTDQRVKARVARAVDLEQITGRLALAEANLLIETANLHDTTARFQRLVGRLPSSNMPLPPAFDQGLPRDVTTALVQTTAANASVLAAIENVRAANAALDVRQSAYVPRVDFRVRRDQGRNIDGLPGSTNANVAEVVLNWNLFNGLSDRARERQFAEELNVARDVRDKTCRDTRQTTMIAFNDTVKLNEQLEYLKLHESSLSKALTAYRLQYQIGQRSLLDLLDTENERFQARRSVVNARYDLETAYVRTQAGVGNLLRAMNLSSLDSGEELRNWMANGDSPQSCPPEPVAMVTIDKDALTQRALQNVARNPMPPLAAGPDAPAPGAPPLAAPVAPAVPAAPAASAPATPPARAASAPAPTPTPAAAVPPHIEEQLRTALESWRAAWAKLDANAYVQSYAPDFVPLQGQTREAWEQRRREVLARSTDVSINLEDVQVSANGPDRATTTFVQNYRSASYQDRVRKTLRWRRVAGGWVIVRETTEAVAR